jgi:hypothetical protein
MKAAYSLLFICIVISKILPAQSKICFSYDDSGNRTSRYECSKSAIATADSIVVTQPITKNLGEISFSLYPNPTKGQLTIIAKNMPSDIQGEVSLFDLNGRHLFRQNSIQETTLVDISSQPLGIYVLRIRASDKTHEWKVIKE